MTFNSPTPKTTTKSMKTGRFVVRNVGKGAYVTRASSARSNSERRARLDKLIAELEKAEQEKAQRERRFRLGGRAKRSR